MAGSILSSFLDGFTGGNFFCRVGRPGAPTQLFADEDSDYPQKELVKALVAIQKAEDQAREATEDQQSVAETISDPVSVGRLASPKKARRASLPVLSSPHAGSK